MISSDLIKVGKVYPNPKCQDVRKVILFLPFNRSSPSNIWWHLRPRKAANKAHSRTYAELRISQFRAQNKLTISKLKPVKFLDRRVSPSVSLFLLFCKQIFTECSLHQKRTACLAYTFGVNALNWPKCHIFHVVSAKRGETPGVKLENLMMKCWHIIFVETNRIRNSESRISLKNMSSSNSDNANIVCSYVTFRIKKK